jgi:hypothetical protein
LVELATVPLMTHVGRLAMDHAHRYRRQQTIGLPPQGVQLMEDIIAARHTASSSSLACRARTAWRVPIMRLDASNFDAVWQHICARALVDHAQGTLIASFVKEDGHWIQAVQPERIRVTSRIARGKGVRSLAQSLFREEWKKLTSLGYSSHVSDQAIWDLLACYFEDVGRNTRSPLRWTSVTRARPSR